MATDISASKSPSQSTTPPPSVDATKVSKAGARDLSNTDNWVTISEEKIDTDSFLGKPKIIFLNPDGTEKDGKEKDGVKNEASGEKGKDKPEYSGFIAAITALLSSLLGKKVEGTEKSNAVASTEATPETGQPSKQPLSQEKINNITATFDPNGDGTVDKQEAQKFAQMEKDYLSKLPPELKSQISENIANSSAEERSGMAGAARIEQLTGLKIGGESAAIIMDGMKEGVSVSNLNAKTLAEARNQGQELQNNGASTLTPGSSEKPLDFSGGNEKPPIDKNMIYDNGEKLTPGSSEKPLDFSQNGISVDSATPVAPSKIPAMNNASAGGLKV